MDVTHPHPQLPYPRHNSLVTLTDHLTEITWGKNADSIPSAAHAVILLPAFAWVIPIIEVGRKGFDKANNGPCTLPIRCIWHQGRREVSLAHLSAGATINLTWHLLGLGHDCTGSVSLSPVDSGIWALCGPDATITPHLHPEPITGAVEAFVAKLPQQGNEAKWAALEQIAPLAKKAILRKTAALSYELRDWGVELETSPDHADEILDHLMLGRSGDTSPMLRLIEALLAEDATKKVDPLRRICTTLSSHADPAVRYYYGDARCGKRIRACYRRGEHKSIESVYAAWQQAHPHDSHRIGKVSKALSLAGIYLPSLP